MLSKKPNWLSMPMSKERTRGVARGNRVIGIWRQQPKRIAMNIAYLIWLENLSTPILTGQVVEVLEEMGKTSGRHNLYLFAFQPLYRIIFKRGHLAEVRRRLRASGVKTVIIPCLAIPHVDLFRARWFMMPLILFQSFPTLLLLTLLKRIDILHCRSYPVTWAAMILRRLLAVKMVFDPRSDFPGENVTAGKWSAGSLTHRAWKRLEERVLQEADATVAITGSYVDHFGRVAPEARFYLVPNNVDTERFRRDTAFRDSFRQTRGIGEDTVVFCYNGSMGGHWHNPGPYADFIVRIRELGLAHWFLFITPGTEAVTASLGEHGVGPEEYGTVNCRFEEVSRYLSVADFGTMFMPAPNIALGTKTVEYLAAGLPLVVNRKAAGAAEIVARHAVGLVVDNERTADLDAVREMAGRKKEMSYACRQLAETRFSTATIAEKYLKLYDNLTS